MTLIPGWTRSWRLVVALVAGALLLSGCKFNGAYDLPLPGKQVSKGDGYVVKADFTDVVDVVPRTTVMVSDVPVGQVLSVDRVGWHARVTMRIRKDIVLPANATADVRQTSLLGEKYIALLPPTGTAARGRLADGAQIPLSRTGRNPEVEEVLGALSFLLSGGGVGQLKTISSELNKMMDGRTDDLRQLMARINQMVGTLDDQKDDIIAAMASINHLSATLVRERRTIGAALDSFGPALKVLNQQHQALMTMLRQLDRLGTVGTRVLNASKDNIVASMRHLQPVLTRLADAGDSLPRGVSLMASFPFPQQAAQLAKGDYANALFHMDIDLRRLVNGTVHGGRNGLPNLVNLCTATPLAPACQQLPPDLLKEVCALNNNAQLCNGSGDSSPVLPNYPGLLSGGGGGLRAGTSSPSLDSLLGGGGSP